MITMPRMRHAVAFAWLPMYRWAAGSSSWHTMKTIMPPTIEKTMPKTRSVKTGCSTAKPAMPPIGSVSPERNDQKKALVGLPVA